MPLRIAAGMGEAQHLLVVGGLSPSRVEPVPTVEGHERIGVVEPLGRQRLEKSIRTLGIHASAEDTARRLTVTKTNRFDTSILIS